MRVLITAGPTREAIDPVRYIANRSSGRMGYALAEAAQDAGHTVTLVSGPVNLQPPAGANFFSVESAQEMFDAVARIIKAHDVAIFAAAVADFRPVSPAAQKLKKSEEPLTLELERTPDILGSVRVRFGFDGYLVGFAAETENLIPQAQAKLAQKACDLIVANDVSRPGIGFDSSDNEVTLCLPGGKTMPLGRKPKIELAREIIRFIEQRVAAQGQ